MKIFLFRAFICFLGVSVFINIAHAEVSNCLLKGKHTPRCRENICFNEKHFACGEAYFNGRKDIAVGGHIIDKSVCKKNGQNGWSCPYLKVEDAVIPRDNKDIFNSSEVAVRNDKGFWVYKEGGSTFFPLTETKDSVVEYVFQALKNNVPLLAQHVTKDGTLFCVPKNRAKSFNTSVVVKKHGTQYNVVTTFPVKACKSGSILLNTNDLKEVAVAQRKQEPPRSHSLHANQAASGGKSIGPKATGNVFSYSSAEQKHTSQSDPLPEETPRIKSAEKSIFAQEAQSQSMNLVPVLPSVKNEEPAYSSPSESKDKKKRKKIKNKIASTGSAELQGREVDEDGDVFFDSSSQMPRTVEAEEEVFYDARSY